MPTRASSLCCAAAAPIVCVVPPPLPPSYSKKQVSFPQPVLVTAVTATEVDAVHGLRLPQIFSGYAKDVCAPTAARFVPLFASVVASSSCSSSSAAAAGQPVDQVMSNVWAATQY